MLCFYFNSVQNTFLLPLSLLLWLVGYLHIYHLMYNFLEFYGYLGYYLYLWSENMFYIKSVLLTILQLVLWFNIVYFDWYSVCAWKECECYWCFVECKVYKHELNQLGSYCCTTLPLLIFLSTSPVTEGSIFKSSTWLYL